MGVLLCGCSSHSNSLAPHVSLERASLPVYSAAATGIPSLAVSRAKGPSIELFNAMDKKVGDLSTPDYGFLSFDRQGDIYLSELNEAALLIYAPPYTQAPTTINLPGNGGQVAVDWKTGVFAVIASPESPFGIDKILFFRHGETKPCKAIYPKFGNQDSYAVFDAEGTLFAAVADNNDTDTVISFAGECDAKSYQTYSPALNVNGLLFNSSDQLVVSTYTVANRPGPVVTYGHPHGGVLGAPVHKTYLKDVNGFGMYADAISSDDKTLWATNSRNAIAQYNYPSGGSPLRSIDITFPDWVVAYPQLTP